MTQQHHGECCGHDADVTLTFCLSPDQTATLTFPKVMTHSELRKLKDCILEGGFGVVQPYISVKEDPKEECGHDHRHHATGC